MTKSGVAGSAEVFGSETNSSAVLNMQTYRYLLIPDDEKDEEPQRSAKDAHLCATCSELNRKPGVHKQGHQQERSLEGTCTRQRPVSRRLIGHMVAYVSPIGL